MSMRSFDLHPKPASSFRSRNAIGGLATILAGLFALILAIWRIVAFDVVQAHVVVDEHEKRETTIRFHLDISFVPSSSSGSGTTGLVNNIRHDCTRVVFEALDPLRRPIGGSGVITSRHSWNEKECRVVGYVDTFYGKGTFRVVAPMHFVDHKIIEMYVGTDTSSKFKRIRHFVPKKALLFSTVDLEHDVITQGKLGVWSYYIKLIPTHWEGVVSSQIAATRHFTALHPGMVDGTYVIYHYETSPLKMTFTGGAWDGLASSLVAIVGGTFALVGGITQFFIFRPKLGGGGKKKQHTKG
jgi:hypothetical protein